MLGVALYLWIMPLSPSSRTWCWVALHHSNAKSGFPVLKQICALERNIYHKSANRITTSVSCHVALPLVQPGKFQIQVRLFSLLQSAETRIATRFALNLQRNLRRLCIVVRIPGPVSLWLLFCCLSVFGLYPILTVGRFDMLNLDCKLSVFRSGYFRGRKKFTYCLSQNW